MDIYEELEKERRILEQMVVDRLKQGLPLNDEVILKQDQKVDDLLNKTEN
jgi:hypothetical protein